LTGKEGRFITQISSHGNFKKRDRRGWISHSRKDSNLIKRGRGNKGVCRTSLEETAEYVYRKERDKKKGGKESNTVASPAGPSSKVPELGTCTRHGKGRPGGDEEKGT